MASYIGVVCGYCNNILSQADDIVVCPICGTPHHRTCYFEHNECFNDALHEEGFEFTKPEVVYTENTIICSHCGRVISKDCDFCNYCGAPQVKEVKPDDSQKTVFMYGTKLFQGETTRTDLEEKIDDIPIKHWVTYIGHNHNYYVNIFKLQDLSKRKFSFTLSAVLFPFMFFLYRRIWGAAIISAITNLIFNLPSIIVMYLAPLGITFGISIVTLDRISSVFSIINMLINVAWGIFAAWIYRKSASNRMSRIKTSTNSDIEFDNVLRAKSGTSITATILGVVALTLAIFLLSLFFGVFDNLTFL